jgi:hypothetical protein
MWVHVACTERPENQRRRGRADRNGDIRYAEALRQNIFTEKNQNKKVIKYILRIAAIEQKKQSRYF